jgi:hypothetical protein
MVNASFALFPEVLSASSAHTGFCEVNDVFIGITNSTALG